MVEKIISHSEKRKRTEIKNEQSQTYPEHHVAPDIKYIIAGSKYEQEQQQLNDQYNDTNGVRE